MLAKRSEVMSRIRGSGNRDTELRLMGLFREHGITGWRRKATIPFNGVVLQKTGQLGSVYYSAKAGKSGKASSPK